MSTWHITNPGIPGIWSCLEPMPQWYAVQTRSNFETKIAGQLSAKGINVYLPILEKLNKWQDRIKRISVPLLPGYVFVRFTNLASTRLSILQTSGVVRILGAGGRIEAIPDSEVESIRLLVNAGVPCFDHPFLCQGTTVYVKSGILKGVEGILVRTKNQSRVVISVPLLSRSVAAEVSVHDVEPLSVGSITRR